jgi:hypothetical protein
MNTTPKYNTDDEVFPRVVQCVLEPKPFEFAQLYEGPPTDMCECTLLHPPVQVGIVKKVRFGEDNVKTFDADRFDNICERSPEPFDPTIHISGTDSQRELYDCEALLTIMENNLYNNFSDREAHKLFRKTKILSKSEVNNLRQENYSELDDPIGFISSELLLGTDDVVKKYPVDIVMDCILNIMEIIYSITELNTCNVIYYRGGLSVCNRPGKNQKAVLERKLEQIMICV